MNDQNRVLARKGARDLTEKEVEQVCGGLRTATKCSVTAAGSIDGNLHDAVDRFPGGLSVARK